MSESELWNLFRKGDRQSFDRIYYQYVQELLKYGDNITSRKAMVEDCVQDVFVELWQKHHRLSSTDSIKYYLFTCLRRKIYRRLAEENKLYSFDLHSSNALIVSSPEKLFIASQSSSAQQYYIQKSICQLPHRQREAIYLKYYNNLSFQETAELMEISVKATYKLVAKAVKSLRKQLTSYSSAVSVILAMVLLSWLSY